LSKGITPLIISVRQGDLPENFVGREINEQFINELISKNTDIMAEGGEYQSFVVSAPNMKGKIVIDDFDIRLVVGKNGKEKFYRMFVNKFHVEK
jgi:diphthamide synthase (EF-2-diphthine--ammonia ligase)